MPITLYLTEADGRLTRLDPDTGLVVGSSISPCDMSFDEDYPAILQWLPWKGGCWELSCLLPDGDVEQFTFYLPAEAWRDAIERADAYVARSPSVRVPEPAH